MWSPGREPSLFLLFLVGCFRQVAAQEGRIFPPKGAEHADRLEFAIEWATRAIEAAGILAIILGALFASAAFVYDLTKAGEQERSYGRFRSRLGRSILLGLEFLVAADIIATVAINPTLESLAVLAGIVAIRTFLSFTLELEIDGRWRWQSRTD